jgi:hypothetical protein
VSYLQTGKGALLQSIFIGSTFFSFIFGLKPLNPANVNWLYFGLNSDPIQHYYGWLFFKDSQWGIPIGENLRYGDSQASSIVYSDSIPLLAIAFKLLTINISSEFQYFGIWILLCFILQSFFTIRIAQLFTLNVGTGLVFAGLMVFSPVLFWRLQVHFALSAHFVLIAAIYLILKSYHRKSDELWNWALLLCVSALIHPYLFGMLLILWMGVLLDLFRMKFVRRSTITFKFASTLFFLIITCQVIAGYDFSDSNSMQGTSVEFGVYRWNPAAVVVPYGKSLFFSKLIRQEGNFDSYTYLGAGIFFLSAIYLFGKCWRKVRLMQIISNNRFLALSNAALISFALSNQLAIGNLRFQYPLPEIFIKVFSIFSASARFVWPVMYTYILVITISILINFRRKTAFILLSLGFLIQVVDSFPLISNLNQFANSNVKVENAMLNNSEIETMIQQLNYEKLVVLPSGERVNFGFPELTLLAYKNRLSTNSVYLSRVNKARYTETRTELENQLQTGNLDPKSIYVLTSNQLTMYNKVIPRTSRIIEAGNYIFIFPHANLD